MLHVSAVLNMSNSVWKDPTAGVFIAANQVLSYFLIYMFWIHVTLPIVQVIQRTISLFANCRIKLSHYDCSVF